MRDASPLQDDVIESLDLRMCAGGSETTTSTDAGYVLFGCNVNGSTGTYVAFYVFESSEAAEQGVGDILCDFSILVTGASWAATTRSEDVAIELQDLCRSRVDCGGAEGPSFDGSPLVHR